MSHSDPNEWNESYVRWHKSACIDVLKDTHRLTLRYYDEGNFAAAIAGIDRMLNGLIVMQNARCGNCVPLLCGLSFVEGDIVACGMEDAPTDRRRAVAIQAFQDARDFSNAGIGELANAAVEALQSGMSFEEFCEEFDPAFPDSEIRDILADVADRLDALR